MVGDKSSIVVNISNTVTNCGQFEQEALIAIDDFNNATTGRDADIATEKLIFLNMKGVLFQSNLACIMAISSHSRLPSLDILLTIPGFIDIYNQITKHWTRISLKDHLSFFKRAILSIFLCNTATNLLDIDQKAWQTITDSWRDDEETFKPFCGNNKCRHAVLRKIAEAYSALNNNYAYKKILGRKPQHKTLGVFSADYMLKNPTPETSAWAELYVKWLNNQRLKTTAKQNKAYKFFIGWLENYPSHITQNPAVFLSDLRRDPSIYSFGGNKKAFEIGTMSRFVEWIIDEQMMDSSEDGVVRLGYSIITANEASSMKQDLPVWASESTSNPLPTRWRIKVATILTDDNFAWPKSLLDQYFTWTDPETGISEPVWVPTLTYLFLTMLEIPLRRIQILCLDSGEGDLVRYDPITKKWVENTVNLAGYWKRHPDAKVVNRGVIKKMGTDDRPVAGFHINTNKTQDKNAPSGEFTGYNIPWQNEQVIQLFTDLRNWQEKYNPVKSPTSLLDIDCRTVLSQQPTEKEIKDTPERFYLFRSPLASNGFNPYSPPTYDHCRKFWLKLMAKLEEVLNNDFDDVKIIERWNEKNGQPEETAYNIHGLRVATLTALAEEGVPIELLSKIIAGHASILMTIYYIKFDAATIAATIKNAGTKIRGNEAESYRTLLDNKSFEEASKLVVYADEEAFRSVMKSKILPVWSNEGYGVCPHAGTRCADGGPILKKTTNRASIYDAVPGGSHNCLRCRHFITGTAFLLQMWMKTNKLLADSQKLSTANEDMRLELEALEEEKFRLSREGRKDDITGAMRNRIKQLEATFESNSIMMDEILLNLHSAYRFTEGIKSLNNSDDSNATILPALLTTDEDIYLGFRETTRFEQLTHIISASRIFPFLKDENYEMEQQRFLDVFFMRENLMPLCIMPLSNIHKRIAADAAADYLLTTVGVAETQQIYEGKITLQQLGFNAKSIVTAMKKAVPMLTTPGRNEVSNG